jgi:hypothetical protein
MKYRIKSKPIIKNTIQKLYLNIIKFLKNKIWYILFFIRRFCAIIIYLTGKKPSCSTFIDEVSITAGYGQLNDFGDWQYSLPKKYIKKQFKGCLMWKDFSNKCKN